MKSIKLIDLIIIAINLVNLTISQLNGKCGYPGKPYKAKLEPDNKLQYLEGEEVTYQCTDFWSSVQTRRCERGRWMGQPARCGEFVDGVILKNVKLEDISSVETPVLKFKYLNMTLSDNDSRYPNAFTSKRFEKPLRVLDNKRYKWTLKFNTSTVKLFVRINFHFINYTLLTAEQKQNFTFNISINVSPERKCVLNNQNEHKWENNGLKIENDFTCDSFSLDSYEKDIKTPANVMSIETESSIALPHDLIAIYFGKSYGTVKKPICGEPETAVSHLSRFNEQYIYYIIDCKNMKTWRYVPKNNDDVLYESSILGLTCVGDMIWKGTHPDCIPVNSCPLNMLLIGPSSNHTVITSFNGLYFLNQTQYYAIEGTEANYGCLNPSSDILVGKETRICLKNGMWNSAEPYCYDPNETGKFPVLLLIGILGGSLTFVVILTGILFYIYSKRIRNRIVEQIANQKRPESGGFDEYDDIEMTSHSVDKETYDTFYEDVKYEEEVRYTKNKGYSEPYYSSEQDYVKVPQNHQIYASYCSGPSNESTYLEMTVEPKPKPRVSPRKSLKKDKESEYCEMNRQ